MVKAPYHQMLRPRAVGPAGCPVDHGFPPYRSDYLKNPFPGLRDLRTKTPVFYAAELGYVVLTRMADVAKVFKRADAFSSELCRTRCCRFAPSREPFLTCPTTPRSRSCPTVRRLTTPAFANIPWPGFRPDRGMGAGPTQMGAADHAHPPGLRRWHGDDRGVGHPRPGTLACRPA